MPRDLPARLAARRTLKRADRRGLRRRAGISAAALAEGLGVEVWRIYEWESGRCLPGCPLMLASYARVIAGLARHEQISTDEEEACDAVA
jgi:DNA-binding XRE family transcriptional regulator